MRRCDEWDYVAVMTLSAVALPLVGALTAALFASVEWLVS